MTGKSRGSDPVKVHTVFLPPDEGGIAGQTWVTVEHHDRPGLLFVLGFAGASLFSLEVRPFSEKGAEWPFDPRNRPAGAIELTAASIRRLPLGDVITAGRAAIASKAARALETFQEVNQRLRVKVEPGEAIRRVAAEIQTAKRPGRRGRTDHELAVVAARYVELLATGPGVPRLAAEMYLSEAHVRSLLTQARARGLMTKAPPGRPGGELTEKAVRLLEGSTDGAR